MTQLGQELLRPSSQYYTTPGGATDAAKVHATKEASYLSSMDQFYAQLDESIREFDLGLDLRRDEFGLDEKRFELEGQKFDFTKEQADETSELEWFKAETERIGTRDRGEYYDSTAAQGWEKLEQDEFDPNDYQKMIDLYSQSKTQTGGAINYKGVANPNSSGMYSDYSGVGTRGVTFGDVNYR